MLMTISIILKIRNNKLELKLGIYDNYLKIKHYY